MSGGSRTVTAGLAGLQQNVEEKDRALVGVAQALDALPLAVVLIDTRSPEHPILHLNPPAAKVAGIARPAARGRPVTEIFAIWSDLAEVVGRVSHTREAWEGRGVQLGDHHYDIDLIGLRDPSGQQDYLLISFADVTDTVEQRERLRLLSESAELFAEPVPGAGGGALAASDVIVDRVLRLAATAVLADRVVFAGSAGAETRPPAVYEPAPPGPTTPPAPPAEQPAPPAPALEVTLTAGGRPMGTLTATRNDQRPFDASDRDSLEIVGRVAAGALHAAEVLAASAAARDSLRAGLEGTLALVGELDPPHVTESLLGAALKATRSDRALIFRRHSGVLEVEAGLDRAGLPVIAGERPSAEARELIAEADWTRRPVARGPLPGAEVEPGEPEAAVAPACHLLVVPLLAGDTNTGFLQLVRRRDRGFDEDELQAATLLAGGAGVAIRNAELIDALRQGNESKGQFMNLAAHELRSPLSVISGYAALLAEGSMGPVPVEWEASIRVMVEKSQELASLIDQVLEASRLQGAPPAGELRPLALRQLVAEMVERAAARARLMGGDIELVLPDFPVTVLADAEQVGRILDNLVNNALNYSVGAPRVSVRLSAEDAMAVIRVEDGGTGIASEHHTRIFREFYRVEGPDAARPPGTGLGLHIARSLAERYRGRLELEWSEPGLGSRFALRLPLAR